MENMQKLEIILSGVGGQGLLMAGNILGKAASSEGKKAAMTTVYGVETRGTFTKSDVIISSEEIDFPEVLSADVVIALDVIAYKRYVGTLGQKTLLIYDSSFEKEPSQSTQVCYPMLGTAEQAGSRNMANIVALGILIKHTSVVEAESVRDSIKDEFFDSPQVLEQNIKAFDTSLNLVD